MLEERIVELIHRDLDRELSEAEQSELHARLEHDADARLFFDEMKGVAEFLESAAQSEPPSDFAERVMTSVRAQSDGEVPRPVVVPFLRRYAAVTVGLGLAAIAAIAFVLAPTIFQSLDGSHLGGTMIEPGRQESPAPAPRREPFVISSGAERVAMRIAPLKGSQRILQVTYDEHMLKVESVTGVLRTSSAPGRLELVMGNNEAVVDFARLSRGPAELSVRSSGGTGAETFESRIEIPAGNNF